MAVDAFSVAVITGYTNSGILTALKIGVAFGLFQFTMPLLGGFAGQSISFSQTGLKIFAACILFILAGKLIADSLMKSEDECTDFCCGRNLVVASFATSVDAFGVGIPLSLMSTPLVISATVIGIVCFILSMVGVKLGGVFKDLGKHKYSFIADYLGAIVLTVIGIKIIVM